MKPDSVQAAGQMITIDGMAVTVPRRYELSRTQKTSGHRAGAVIKVTWN